MPRNETADLWKNIQTGCSDKGAAAPTDDRKPLVHLAMSSRRVTPAEVTTLGPLGLMDNPASEHVIALDGLAIVINRANKVETLTREQIMKIFTGKITNWEQLGGWPAPISMYARDGRSGTRDTFNNLVLKGAAMSAAVKQFEDSRELSDAVARDPDAIGFIGMSYVGEAKAVNIRECNLVYPPNNFNAKTEEYPLSRRLFLYAPQIRNRGIDSFLDYINTDEAQRVVARNGFVDLSIEPDFIGSQRALRPLGREAGRNNHEDDLYASMIKEGGRLSITLRFRANSSDINQMDLDSRAIHDLQRLKDYMHGLKGRGQRVRLVGFSDSAGDYARNRMLSLERANFISKELKDVPQAGVMGLGPNFAVACNDSDEGRAKNRRVEIWLTK
jgi:phosphate transport system substrate-binding protein